MQSQNNSSVSQSGSNSSESSSLNQPPERKRESSVDRLFRISQAKQDAREDYTYENLVNELINKNKSMWLDDYNVFGAYKEGAFMQFGSIMLSAEDKKAFSSSESRNIGWKVHVAVDDSDIANLAKGFNIIKDFVIEEELYCKVVMPGEEFHKESKEEDDRNGRQITLYVCSDPEKDWERILGEMEDKLIQENIRFTHSAKGDNPVQGSLIMGYRNDVNGQGVYISVKDTGYNYNYSNANDEILSYDLSPPGVKFHSR